MRASAFLSTAPRHGQDNSGRKQARSLAVVSHNRIEWLRRCLRAVEGSEERERLQVIVVDNGSLDGSAQLDDEFPQVQFIRLPKNFGLTKALNLGWRAADSPYVFFLHEDTEVFGGAAAGRCAGCKSPGGRRVPSADRRGWPSGHRRASASFRRCIGVVLA